MDMSRDVTLPIPASALAAMHRAVDDMADKTTFHGYGPSRATLSSSAMRSPEGDYRARGVDIRSDEIFISDGAKSDLGNLGDIYAAGNVVAVTDPGYPVYVDSNVIDGRGGELVGGRWSNFIYLDCTEENGFKPTLSRSPRRCGIPLLAGEPHRRGVHPLRTRGVGGLRRRRNNAVIIYDSAYCAYVTSPGVPRSIYEIGGARGSGHRGTKFFEDRRFHRSPVRLHRRARHSLRIRPRGTQGTAPQAVEPSADHQVQRRQLYNPARSGIALQ